MSDNTDSVMGWSLLTKVTTVLLLLAGFYLGRCDHSVLAPSNALCAHPDDSGSLKEEEQKEEKAK